MRPPNSGSFDPFFVGCPIPALRVTEIMEASHMTKGGEGMSGTMTQRRLVRLRVIYALALTVVAVTILASSLLMGYAIGRGSGDSRIVNLAGRQRMLSQRMAKAALALERDPGALDRREELRASLGEFVEAQEGIRHGSAALGLPARSLSPEVQELLAQAEEPYRAMVERLEGLSRVTTLYPGDPVLAGAVQALLVQEPRFLSAMDRLTFRLDAESRARIQGLQRLEWGLLALGLAVLALELLFVFRPSLRQLSMMIDALEQRGEELAAANQAYLELLPFVSHELKNPIASMITDARVMSEGYLGSLDDRQVQKLEKLIAKGDYLLGLVREYMDLARIEGGDLRLDAAETQFVEDVLEPAVDIILPQLQDKGMTLARDYRRAGTAVACDPNLMKIVVVNLLGNAAKYGREQGTVRLTCEGDASGVTVRVWNEGPGFSAQERGLLFRKFSRLQAPELRAKKGTGVGLYTCDRIARLHGGAMEARSEQGAWAEFTLHFPQPLLEGAKVK